MNKLTLFVIAIIALFAIESYAGGPGSGRRKGSGGGGYVNTTPKETPKEEKKEEPKGTSTESQCMQCRKNAEDIYQTKMQKEGISDSTKYVLYKRLQEAIEKCKCP